jgi:hypothetical protein
MELTSNLIVAKTGKIRKELTVKNTMGTGLERTLFKREERVKRGNEEEQDDLE